MRNDEKLQELYKNFYVPADIKKERLEWIEHTAINDHGRVVKNTSGGRPQGRMTGRPRLR